ncbi:MAG: hypothetical protein H6704_13095 [Myxococcales bacterium]|nr:hypothetical protein [Myxococcales bacterium]
MTLAEFCNARELRAVGISLDVDWAPAFVVEDILRRLRSHGLAATVFATHPLESLVPSARLEVGLHPNFAPKSSHGDSPEAVMSRLRSWFPTATGVRTHMLIQSSPLLARFRGFGVEYDSSLLLNDVPYVQPFDTPFGLVRVPYVWADASHLAGGRPCELAAIDLASPGLKVLNFHPILVYLDAESPARYAEAKAACPDLASATREHLEPFIGPGGGIGTLFDALCRRLAERQIATYRLTDLVWAVRRARSEGATSWAPLSFSREGPRSG